MLFCQSVPFEEGRKQRLNIRGCVPCAEFEVGRERVAAVPAHVEAAGKGVEGNQGVENPEVGVAGRITEDSHDRAWRGVLVQDDLPDRVAVSENGPGERLREHQLVEPRESGHFALYEAEIQHAEKHRIDGHDPGFVGVWLSRQRSVSKLPRRRVAASTAGISS